MAIDPELEKYGTATTGVRRGLGRLYEKNAVVVTVTVGIEDDDTITAIGLAGVTSVDGAENQTENENENEAAGSRGGSLSSSPSDSGTDVRPFAGDRP